MVVPCKVEAVEVVDDFILNTHALGKTTACTKEQDECENIWQS